VLIFINPLYLIGWCEWVMPGFFAEQWKERSPLLYIFGVLFISGAAGSMVLAKDALVMFRNPEEATVVRCRIRPFFRGLLGMLGTIMVAVSALVVVRAVMSSEFLGTNGGEIIFMVVGCFVIVGVLCFQAAFSGSPPSWMIARAKKSEPSP
jgi:hypothetical protein